MRRQVLEKTRSVTLTLLVKHTHKHTLNTYGSLFLDYFKINYSMAGSVTDLRKEGKKKKKRREKSDRWKEHQSQQQS